MPNESFPTLPPTPERRTALWPWLLMPFVALALFVALNRVRHLSEIAAVSGPGVDATPDGGG